jgi:hypothetical protein
MPAPPFPKVPLDLLEALEWAFPRIEHDWKTDLRYADYAAGQRSVILRLRREFTAQHPESGGPNVPIR